MIPHDSPIRPQFSHRGSQLSIAFLVYWRLEGIHSSPNFPIIINHPNCPTDIQRTQRIILRYPMIFPWFHMLHSTMSWCFYSLWSRPENPPQTQASSPRTSGHWRRGQEGELDETRLVDALAGEANVFRCRWGCHGSRLLAGRAGWFGIWFCVVFLFNWECHLIPTDELLYFSEG